MDKEKELTVEEELKAKLETLKRSKITAEQNAKEIGWVICGLENQLKD